MNKPTVPSNLYVFFGEDGFSLNRKIEAWKTEFAKKFGASGIVFFEKENLTDLQLAEKIRNELSPSLFASKKLIIIRDCLPRKAEQKDLGDFLLSLPSLIPADYFLIFWETQKPDKRLGFTKKFLAATNVTEFELPHGIALNGWISVMAHSLGAGISMAAADRLAQYMGRDLFEEKKFGGKVVERKEAFDLWEVYTELLKLTSNTTQIEVENVSNLVRAKIPDSVFALTDQIVAKNVKGAFQALENFLFTATAEEKITLIKVVGLLSEQLRSLLIVGLLLKDGQTNEQIAETLGWSSGRVFVTAKNLKNASLSKLKQLLAQLMLIDNRIKSTDANVKLDLDLFLVQATN